MTTSSKNKVTAVDQVERGKWGSQIEFFLSLLGYSVGIGNLVRYPYICLKSGGAAFLIPFFLAHVFCGIPLFIMELLLGQFTGRSPTKIWGFCPLFVGIGYSMTAICALVGFYYIMLIAYCLFYLYSSFSRVLPWKSCGNWWNTELCWDGSPNSSIPFADLSNKTSNSSSSGVTWASDEYWHQRVLGMSDSVENLGSIRWELVLCLAIAWLLVFFSLAWGIKWTGKVVYLTATLPYVFLVALVIRGCTLEGSLHGLYYYLVPDFSKLLLAKTWIQGCSQMFYSLGPGCGCLITMASYNPFRHNCKREGIAMPLLDMVTAVFGGLAIFSVIGFMSHQTGLSIENVATSGPGLSYVIYPLALANLPGAPVWSVVFFLTLITLAIDSMFGYVETILSAFFDNWPQLRRHKGVVVGIVCLIMFSVGTVICTEGGMFVYQVVDWYSCIFAIPIICLLETIAVCFIYGLDRFSSDTKLMLGKPLGNWVKILLYTSIPLTVLMLVMAFVRLEPPRYGDKPYPDYIHSIGYFISFSTIFPIPVAAIWVLINSNPDPLKPISLWQRLKNSVTPNENWVPQEELLRAPYKAMTMGRDYLDQTPMIENMNGNCANGIKI